jgi:hypothetical protein
MAKTAGAQSAGNRCERSDRIGLWLSVTEY